MNLLDPAQLPKSASDGPENWSEAFGRLAAATDNTQRVINNVVSDDVARRDAYDGYIKEVYDATGVQMKNPLDVDLRQGAFDAKPNPQISGGTGLEWREQRLQASLDDFDRQREALAARYPAQARLIQLDIDDRVRKIMQDADREEKRAAQSPELGMAGRFTAQLLGGLKGTARDPYQWAMAVTGGGSSAGSTVAARIGKTMLTEALLNGGQELLIEGANQQRLKDAGLEHGIGDMLRNAGIAATFGALFGGTIQGGSELARVFKLGKGGAERATRILDGSPRQGDVETMAADLRVDLTAEQRAHVSRSFEERTLDETMIDADATPDQARVFEAAKRHAEDPENYPDPALVERAIVAAERDPSLFTGEEYQRLVDGDEGAIDEFEAMLPTDDLPPVVSPERLDEIARANVAVGSKPPAPQSLMDFLASEGGISDHGGELQALDLSRKFVPGRGALVRSSGRSLDYAREAAAEAGYFDHLYGNADRATAESTVADLLDLLEQENRGNRAFSTNDTARVEQMAAYESRLQARQEYREFLGKLENTLREVAPESGIDDGVLARATELMIQEDLPPLAAFDRAVLEDEARFADYLEESGNGYRDDPAYNDIPFFDDEPSATAASTRRSPRAEDGNSNAARRSPDAENSDQPSRAGSDASDGLDARIRPDHPFEPLDDAAIAEAERLAGDIVDPEVDANGNPRSLLDFVPLQDGDGNVRLVTPREALEAADEDVFFADLLEACKL